MGEIKSTLEIVLEKAKAVEISPEDRKRIRRETIFSRAREIFQRYQDHPIRSKNLTEAIQESGENAPLLRQYLVEVFLQAIDLSGGSESVWRGLGELGLKGSEALQKDLHRIIEEDQKARISAREGIETMMRESLIEAGVSGTAIVPRIDAHPKWKKTEQRLEERALAQIHGLREKIARATENHSRSARRCGSSPAPDPSPE